MAWVGAGVATHCLCFAACLLAGLRSILALAGPVTVFLAGVGAAFEQLAADLATAGVCKPAGLILQNFLAAEAGLLCQVWTLGATFVVGMAVMGRLRMATRLGALTRE